MKARLYEKYISEVIPALKERRKYSNPHQVPRMEKIVTPMLITIFSIRGTWCGWRRS